MGKTLSRHPATYPRDHKEKHPSEQLEERRLRLIEKGKQEGWGDLVGIRVLGGEVYYTFENGQQIRHPLPSGSQY